MVEAFCSAVAVLTRQAGTRAQARFHGARSFRAVRNHGQGALVLDKTRARERCHNCNHNLICKLKRLRCGWDTLKSRLTFCRGLFRARAIVPTTSPAIYQPEREADERPPSELLPG